MEVGTKIKIIETCPGCYGAEGKTGVVTDAPSNSGLVPRDAGYNVDVGNGLVWRINTDAKVKILSVVEPMKMGVFSDHTLTEVLEKCRVIDFTVSRAAPSENIGKIVVTYVPEEVKNER